MVLVPEHDDFLRPAEAEDRFGAVPHAELVAVADAKHLWVGENHTARALNEITARLNPAAVPLPTEWDGPLG